MKFGIADDFSYTDSNPNYIVGVEIQNNSPSIQGHGTFKVSPMLVLGLNIDKQNGIISGTPEEEYEGNFTVIFTDENTGDIFSCKIYITGII